MSNSRKLQSCAVISPCETRALFRLLVRAAMRAPSGDNVQPWKFVENADGNCVEVYMDTSRDVSPMNSGQRMALIACGAAIENILLVAHERGWNTTLERSEPIFTDCLSRVAIVRLGTRFREPAPGHGERAVFQRVTNRRLYDSRSVSPGVASRLRQANPGFEGTATHWVIDRRALEELAKVISCGDGILFGEPSMRRAILSNIRFDLPSKAEAPEGLSLASLEISSAQRMAIQAMLRIPHVLFKLMGGSAIFARQSCSLVRSSSGMCIVAMNEGSLGAELQVGRTMQRAWLLLTELGLASQPMMSLIVLENAMRHGSSDLVAALKRRGIERVLARFNSVLMSVGILGRPAFMLRFGYAEPPSGRTGRVAE